MGMNGHLVVVDEAQDLDERIREALRTPPRFLLALPAGQATAQQVRRALEAARA